MKVRTTVRYAILVTMICAATVQAQTPPGQAGGQGQGQSPRPVVVPGTQAPRPATGVYPATLPDDNTGFESIFDGQTLKGWDGDTQFWRVENGAIVGESTPDRVVKVNNFLIWRGGVLRDFELKLEFRMNGANSGIQYRSSEMPEVGKWILRGY